MAAEHDLALRLQLGRNGVPALDDRLSGLE
jgi:hypothetical protein